MKGWILVALCLLMLNISSAQTQQSELGTFKLNECINLIQTCSNCTFVNITSIVSPNSTTTNINEGMTQEGTVYNHTFCETDTIGRYAYWTIGDPDGTLSNPHGVSFKITKTGMAFEEAFTIPLILPLLLILLTSGFSLFLAFRINFGGVKTILIGFSGVLLLFGIIYSLNITNDILSGFETITGGYVLFYRIIVMITWVVFFAITAYLLIMAVDKIKGIRGLK